MKTEIATFGAGCFWEPEQVFSEIPGVIKTQVGYAGGKIKDPTYQQVCSNNTGHAEVVQVTFDPKKISYKELLNIFWKIHNPTTKDRQGLNIGDQYRSIIFYNSQKQKSEAEISLKQIQKQFPNKIVTEIKKATEFYKAEEYHQKYLKKQEKGMLFN